MRRAGAVAVFLAVLIGLTGGAGAGQPRRKITTSRVQKMTPAEVSALRRTWSEARTGNEFMSQTGLKAHDLAALRELHGGFDARPKGRRPAYDPSRVPEMKRDWKNVVSGAWTTKQFVEKWLPGHNYLEALRKNHPGDFDPPPRKLLYDPRKVPAMKRDWKRVERREWQVKDFVARHLDSYEGVLALRRAYPGDFEKIQEKASFTRKRRTVDDLPPAAVARAKELFAAHQRDEVRYSDLLGQLYTLGLTDTDVQRLKSSDPATYASREQFRVAHHDEIIDDVIALARRYRPSIRSLNDLFEVVNRSEEFVARWGRVETDVAQQNWVLLRDKQQGDRLRKALAEEIGITHRPERARRERTRGTRPQMSRSLMWRQGTAPDRGAMARELAERLAREPDATPEAFARVIRELTRVNEAFASKTRVRRMMYTFHRQYPELDRWKLEARKHSLRYVARWTESVHRAGPRATYDDVVAIFRKSPEYAEDPRLPSSFKWSADQVRFMPRGLVIGAHERALYQGTRAWLEGMRTAPRGASMTSVSLADPRRISYATAKKLVATLDAAAMRRLGMDPALLARLKKAKWTGLGEAPDAGFDFNAEPPELDMGLVRDILDMPRIPPLMRMFLDRLKGERPFAGTQTLFVGHRYSDVVPFMETMVAAGMQPKGTRFVTTSYPFNDSTRVVLEHMGIDVLERERSVQGVKDGVERGLRAMLASGDPRPILVFDDGGLATRVIQEKFSGDLHRFKIVEITTAGHRLGMEFRDSFKRMPLVYGSAARNDVKVRITSAAHARRVVDRTIKLVAQSPIELPRRKVVVLGGGAMGDPAVRALVRRQKELLPDGLEVVVVDPDPAVARKLARVARVQTLEQALPGAGMVLGMTGLELVGPQHLALLEDDTILVQGSSKRNEFDMEGFEKAGVKTLIPRTDGLPQESYTYRFGRGAAAKRLHFLGDGWTINHDGSLHGTAMDDLQLELAVLLETARLVAKTSTQRTGQVIELGPDVQQEYVEAKKALDAKNRKRR